MCAHLASRACIALRSMYRWVAIRGEPLAGYFALEETNVRDLTPFMG